MTKPVLIIGGGLSGLVAALTLHRAGVVVRLLEARARLGGRILSEDGFDLGPSWLWPQLQPDFTAFVQQLGCNYFAQEDAGDFLFQHGSGPAQRYARMRQEPRSMRIMGGMAALVAAIARELPREVVTLGTRVMSLTREDDGLQVTTQAGDIQLAQHVMLALPPRLAATHIRFAPSLPPASLRRWKDVPTWMAPHAKFVAVYDRPFWRKAGLSGAVRSQIGPLVEIHDATTADGKAALFGFVGVPATARMELGEQAVIDASVAQLAQLFGLEARRPQATYYKDWAADPKTAIAEDYLVSDHPAPTGRPWVEGAWANCLTLIGSETSQTEPGYLAGAYEAANRGAAVFLARQQANTSERTPPCA